MEQLTFFLALAVGLIFGGLTIWLILRADTANAYQRARGELAAAHTALTERLSGREARIEDLTKEREQHRLELQRLREDNSALVAAKAELETRLEDAVKSSGEKLAQIRDAREQLAESFRAMSAQALESNNRMFLDLARQSLENAALGANHDIEGRRQSIDEVVKPLRESLEKVGHSIQDLERSRVAAYAGMSEQVRSLIATQDLLRTETSNLVNALRTPAVRGRWGELQLRRVAELAGMVPYCDFEEQVAVATEDGRVRPDMIIRLPNNREVVVDAKVSLKAFLEALDAPDEQQRTGKLQQHAAQVRAHLERLSSKAYWERLPSTPEFVVAFLPGESFFSAALQQDPTLLEYGVEHNVILATPTTLIALLKAVAFGWRQEKLARNAEEISHLGRDLYTRLRTFAGHIEDIRRNLTRTVDSYNRAAGALESRVLVSARRLHDLGASAKGEIRSVHAVDTFTRPVTSLPEEALQTELFEAAPPEPVSGLAKGILELPKPVDTRATTEPIEPEAWQSKWVEPAPASAPAPETAPWTEPADLAAPEPFPEPRQLEEPEDEPEPAASDLAGLAGAVGQTSATSEDSEPGAGAEPASPVTPASGEQSNGENVSSQPAPAAAGQEFPSKADDQYRIPYSVFVKTY